MDVSEVSAKLRAAAGVPTFNGDAPPAAVVKLLNVFLDGALREAPKSTKLDETAAKLIDGWKAEKGPPE